MVHNFVSINQIMASIVSKQRLTDSSWYNDIYEWIIEGYKLIKLRQPLYQTSKELQVYNYEVYLPCGLVYLDAVIYNKYRLKISQNSLDTTKEETAFSNPIEVYETTQQIVTVDDVTTTTSTTVPKYPVATYLSYPYSREQYYKLFPDKIQTSFKEGKITIVYVTYPVDEEGYLLIPDNGDLKLALYYYVLTSMIGAGYTGSIFKWAEADQLWEKHVGRAINQIKQPSPDKMNSLKHTVTRLVQPLHYHESFLSNPDI